MNVVAVFETLGLIAFSISGSVVGIRRKIDIFGLLILALMTSCGGGILRDLLLGSIPPVALRTPYYLLVSLCTTVVCFFYFKFIYPKFNRRHHKLLYLVQLFDAMGLGLFTVSGISIARGIFPQNEYLCVFIGVVTAIGGGMLRDVLANQVPLVFRKELYATPAIVGGILFEVLIPVLGLYPAMYFCAALIFVARMVSIRYLICLPSIKIDKKKMRL